MQKENNVFLCGHFSKRKQSKAALDSCCYCCRWSGHMAVNGPSHLIGCVRNAVFRSSTTLFLISISSSSKANRVCICGQPGRQTGRRANQGSATLRTMWLTVWPRQRQQCSAFHFKAKSTGNCVNLFERSTRERKRQRLSPDSGSAFLEVRSWITNFTPPCS